MRNVRNQVLYRITNQTWDHNWGLVKHQVKYHVMHQIRVPVIYQITDRVLVTIRDQIEDDRYE